MQIVSIDIDQIENVVEHRETGATWDSVSTRAKACALLDQAERRASLFVESDDFSIEHSLLCIYELRHGAQLGILPREVVLITRDQADLAGVDERDGAVAVPLDFKEPIWTVERVGYCRDPPHAGHDNNPPFRRSRLAL